MKKRYIYLLLYGIPGLGVAFLASALAAGMTFGFFWLFMFGDTAEWPFWTELMAAVIAVIVFVATFSLIVKIGFSIGKKREMENLPVERKHIVIPALILAFIIFYIIIALRNSS